MGRIEYRLSEIQHARAMGYYVTIDIWDVDGDKRIGEHGTCCLSLCDMITSTRAMSLSTTKNEYQLTPAKRLQLEAMCRWLSDRENLLINAGQDLPWLESEHVYV